MVKQIIIVLGSLIGLLLCAQTVSAQQDSIPKGKTWLRRNVNDLFHQVRESISHNPADTIDRNRLLIVRSENDYQHFEGRVIRDIHIRQLGFEKKLADTAHTLITLGTKIYNRLHVNTRESIIRNFLFIRKGQKVNAYDVADNERLLRTLNFIQDARMVLAPAGNDSVDVTVITKDLFSIMWGDDISDWNSARASLGDANFLGWAQQIELGTLYDINRTPLLGFRALYSKTNIAGTFINGTAAHSVINSGFTGGKEQEAITYARFELPLISPNKHWAGGLLLGSGRAINVYQKNDTDYYRYHYQVADAWVGYNRNNYRLSSHAGKIDDRNRTFLALRYVQYQFKQMPYQTGDSFNLHYNNRQALLAQITFYKQDFYKTQYVYGFGTTEDLPYGYSLSLISGLYRQQNLLRPYAGIDANKYIASAAGEFYQLFARGGGYFNQAVHKADDLGILLGASVFGRLLLFNRLKIRQYFRASYARLFDRITTEPLYVNNQFGLNDFSANTDSTSGIRRINAYAENIFYTNYKVLGFAIAPFVFVNGVLLTPAQKSMAQSNTYTGFGGGLRVRNENLTFGTVELRVVYFPVAATGVQALGISVNSNITFRYRNNYISPPNLLQLNLNPYVY
jgi:hypothetical protein